MGVQAVGKAPVGLDITSPSIASFHACMDGRLRMHSLHTNKWQCVS